jgi:hypothetical protein
VRAAAIGLLVGACAPAAAPTPIAHRAADHAAVEQPRRLLYRHLSVGSHAPTAIRTTWELTIDGSRASLVQTEQHAPGPFTIARADREAKWTTARTHSQEGPLREVGDHIVLELESAVDSLFLYCWHRAVAVAVAGARRVPRPGHQRDCSDPGTWSPTSTRRVDVLVCGQEDAGDFSDLETHWHFAAAPGVELVEEIGDCLQGAGLRLAK